MTTKTVFKATLTAADARRMWAEMKEDAAALAQCDRHRFGRLNVGTADRVRCARCGGEMKASDVVLYCRGFKAAGGDARLVCPNFEGDAI